MRVTIAAIGRERAGPAKALFQLYCARCPWPVSLAELAPRPIEPLERRLADEADRLLTAAGNRAVLIALDERGRDLDSRGFADQIASWRDGGRAELAFLIGGPDGLGRGALERAELRLAFGRMTWPHQLVRVMLAEQLYRASTILAGHPYHRD